MVAERLADDNFRGVLKCLGIGVLLGLLKLLSGLPIKMGSSFGTLGLIKFLSNRTPH